MAKSSKKLSKKIEKIVKSDIFTSIAIVSILFNILFLVCVFVLTSTDTFDSKLYNGVKDKYCANSQVVAEEAGNLVNEDKDAEALKVMRQYQVDCNVKEFQPYLNEAVKKFEATFDEEYNL